MLFNSYVFIFGFLPVVLIAFYLISIWRLENAKIGLVMAASLVFYGWFSPSFIPVIIFSILLNYGIGMRLRPEDAHSATDSLARRRGFLVGFAVASNLGLLGYYKYMGYFVGLFDALGGHPFEVASLILPLGISFFTFQQIAFIVDRYNGQAEVRGFLNYGVFVMFFPQLIAGPIVHHREMMPQFAKLRRFTYRHRNLAAGLMMFALGLFKKVVIADGISVYADPVFVAAALPGATLTFFEAWTGVFAFALEIYFDFSGYSDMAMGLARMFGIKLPVNFNSPYKSASMIEFWSRWHITLSRFLTAYIFNPIALRVARARIRSKKPILKASGVGTPGAFTAQLVFPIMLTLLLAGVWHGAGPHFAFYGIVLGAYLVVNHAWRQGAARRGRRHPSRFVRLVYVALTFVAVAVALSVFNSQNMAAFLVLLEGLAGLNGMEIALYYRPAFGPFAGVLESFGVVFGAAPYFRVSAVLWIVSLLAFVWLLPNVYQLTDFAEMRGRSGTLSVAMKFSPRLVAAFRAGLWLTAGGVGAWAVASLSGTSRFIYFQF